MTMIDKISFNLINKVVFTVDLDSYLSSTIELATVLALANQTGLHGLFVEDINLLHMASLPFTREVSLVDAQSRVLDHQQLHCSFSARSRHFRQSLVRHAEQMSLPWSYSTARGQKIKIALESSLGAEYLIIGQSENVRFQASSPTKIPRRILLLNNHNQRLFQALDVVLESSPTSAIELLVVSSTDESTLQNRDQLIKKLSDHPNSRIVEVDRDSLSIVLAIQNQPVAYLIAPRKESEMVRLIMQQLSCPVIVVA